MTVCLLIQCVFFIFIPAAGGGGQIRNTENRCILRIWIKFVDPSCRVVNPFNYGTQSPKPDLAKDKSFTCVPLEINGLSSRSRAQRSQTLQSALQGIRQGNMTVGSYNVGMAQVDTTENKELKSSPWSTQSSGFISRLNHSGRKDVGRTEVKKDSIVQLLIQIAIISKSSSTKMPRREFKLRNLPPGNHHFWLVQIDSESQEKCSSVLVYLECQRQHWALLM